MLLVSAASAAIARTPGTDILLSASCRLDARAQYSASAPLPWLRLGIPSDTSRSIIVTPIAGDCTIGWATAHGC